VISRSANVVPELIKDTRKRTFKEKLKLWGFEKNIPARDMRVIVAMVDERKRKQGKETRVYFKDRLVDAKKMDRFKKRKLHHEPEEEVYLHSEWPGYARI
jgi:hypothetical protein